MEAIELLLENLDVEKVLHHYEFDNVKPSGNFIRASCRIHGGDNPTGFVINAVNGVWSCHTGSCGNGSIFHLIQRIERCGFPQAVNKLAEILGIDITELKIIAVDRQDKKELRKWLDTIRSMQKQEIIEYQPIMDSVKVTKFKEFEPSTLEFFGLHFAEEYYGTTSEGKELTLKDRLVFPVYFDSKLVMTSIRATKKSQQPKWLHQPADIHTGDLLYNYDNAKGKSEIAVVEGITDVWAFHEIGITAVATYGAHITQKQKRLLLMLGCKLIFCFDNDDAGVRAGKKAKEMFEMTSDIAFIHLPTGADPESVSREELTNYYGRKNIHPI